MNKRETKTNKDLRKMILLKKMCQTSTMNSEERLQTLELFKTLLSIYSDIITREILEQTKDQTITLLPSNNNSIRLHYNKTNYTIDLKEFIDL